ncbi:MAG: histidine triad nucleotide-binding protein [Anaerolineales bacterium]|nr:histidine triad nucleotide-binding protein [Anaerolineales bacterium]MBS3753559.1 histidine triad nucleotide-binding protein [Anaerolineales bacterium]
MPDCIFCKIINDEIDSDKVYTDDQVTAFHDINPVSPVHLLVIPNKHIESVQNLEEEDQELMGHMFSVIGTLTEKFDIHRSGYRLIINNGPDAHQEVPHLHVHILGGKTMEHPMG